MRFESLDGPAICDHLNDVLLKAFPSLVSETEENGLSEVVTDDDLRLHLTFAEHSDADILKMTNHLRAVLPEMIQIKGVSASKITLASGGGVNRVTRVFDPLALTA